MLSPDEAGPVRATMEVIVDMELVAKLRVASSFPPLPCPVSKLVYVGPMKIVGGAVELLLLMFMVTPFINALISNPPTKKKPVPVVGEEPP